MLTRRRSLFEARACSTDLLNSHCSSRQGVVYIYLSQFMLQCRRKGVLNDGNVDYLGWSAQTCIVTEMVYLVLKHV